MSQPVISEGIFIYLLGVVVLVTRPGRFWLGFALAAIPIMAGLLIRTYDSARARSRRS